MNTPRLRSSSGSARCTRRSGSRTLGPVPDAAIATVGGRYFGMDRDQRWERVEKHWRALVMGEGLQAADPVAAVEEAYARGETDEFIQPTVIPSVAHHAIDDHDGLIFFNFRPDRARQMTRALALAEFAEFQRPRRPEP